MGENNMKLEMDRRNFLKTAGGVTLAMSASLLTGCGGSDGGATPPGGSNNSGAGNGGGTSGNGSGEEKPGGGSDTGNGEQTSDQVIWKFGEYGDGTAYLIDFDKKGKRPSGDIVIPSQSDKGSRVTRIQTSALTGYTGFDSAIPEVTSVTLPGTVEEIGMYAFAQAAQMKTITMPGCKKIEQEAFYQCKKLEMVEFGSIQTIERMAFNDCVSLKNITLPKSLTKVGTWAFGNTGIESIVIPGTFEMGSSLFANCVKLKKVIIEPGVTDLHDFRSCTALEEVIYMGTPGKSSCVCDECFYGCTSLQRIYLPNNISIQEGAFVSNYDKDPLPNLTDIYYEGSETEWKKRVSQSILENELKNVTVHYNADASKLM